MNELCEKVDVTIVIVYNNNIIEVRIISALMQMARRSALVIFAIKCRHHSTVFHFDDIYGLILRGEPFSLCYF